MYQTWSYRHSTNQKGSDANLGLTSLLQVAQIHLDSAATKFSNQMLQLARNVVVANSVVEHRSCMH